ncbi:MAG: FAD-dependent monooxygenase [Pseudomonadota bacterium]
MHVGVIGGGPAGLLFARKIKQAYPAWRVEVFEQNARDATYGFGVGLLGQSLKFIERSDPELLAAIHEVAHSASAMGFVHRGETVVVEAGLDGESVAIERIALLNILQSLCEAVGVDLRFQSRVDDIDRLREEVDVLVAADGVNSRVRERYAYAFGASVEPQRNVFAWYATEHLFDPALMIFEQAEEGLVIAHAYQYRPDRSGMAIECDPDTWARGGFGDMTPEAMDARFAEIFAPYLGGKPLLSGTVRVFYPAIVKNAQWSHKNVVLIGDAVRTVHPSIGSGTRVGMRDADALALAFVQHGEDLDAVFSAYRSSRQFGSDLFQRAAIQSIKWYETLEDRLHFDPVTMAFSYMLRTGRVDYARLRETDPDFVRRYEAAPLPALERGAS